MKTKIITAKIVTLSLICLACVPDKESNKSVLPQSDKAIISQSDQTILPRPSVEQLEKLYLEAQKNKPTSHYQFNFPPGTPKLPDTPNNPMTNAGVELGKWLFYDPILSRDNTMSCGSCHHQHLAFTDGKVKSPGIDGRTLEVNTMSLVNLAWGPQFFWDGRVNSLEQQAILPIINPDELDLTLQQLVNRLSEHPVYPRMFKLAFQSEKIDEEQIGKALAQFIRSLVSFESDLDEIRRAESGLKKEEEIAENLRPLMSSKQDKKTQEGIRLCGSCHIGPNYNESEISRSLYDVGVRGSLYGGTRMANNGLDQNSAHPGLAGVTGNPDERGIFKVPSLRNIAVTAPYMHDGRFKTLDEVFEHYDKHIQNAPALDPKLKDSDGKPIRLQLDTKTKQNLKRYLELMTDKHFLTNPRHSNPFVEPQ